jgi:hypothetical protein
MMNVAYKACLLFVAIPNGYIDVQVVSGFLLNSGEQRRVLVSRLNST